MKFKYVGKLKEVGADGVEGIKPGKAFELTTPFLIEKAKNNPDFEAVKRKK